METEVRRPSSESPDLAPGRTPERRVRRQSLPATRREEPEIALRLGPGGIQEAIPLTREVLLNPSLDVQVVQSPPHDHKLRGLAVRLEPFLRARGLVVHCDVGLDWPGERCVAPDLSVIENLPAPRPGEAVPKSIRLKGSCRVRTVFEVVSPGKEAREKDEKDNPPLFARCGVEEYVLLYQPGLREATDPPIRVFSAPTAAGYDREERPAADGFFELRSIGVRIGVEITAEDGETVVAYDTRTGERLPNVEEAKQLAAQAEQEKQQEAEARRRAEQEKLKAEQEKLQEAEARRRAEQEKLMAEQEKLQEAKARRRAEQLNQEMAAEIERLRAQLRDVD